jgi:hypothetical protein
MSMMSELLDIEGAGRLPRSRTGVIAFILTTLGVLLGATVDMAWLILAGAGIFGPNVLRELGLLRDRDELQQEVARRAGLHAYLIGGLLTLTMVIAKEWGSTDLDDNGTSAAVILLAFMIPYMYSYLTSFWGPIKAAQRILLAFGLFWLIFNVLGNLNNPVAMVMQCLVALPFFGLALLSRFRPRITGVLLVFVSIFAFFFFGMYRTLATNETGGLAVVLLLLVPSPIPVSRCSG